MSSVARRCGRGTPHPRTSNAQTSPPSCPCAHPTTARLELGIQTFDAQGGTCTLTTTMEDMVAKVVAGHHRRLWVVVRHTTRAVCCHPPFCQPNAEPLGQDDAGVPIGVISLTDLINAVADRMDAVKILD